MGDENDQNREQEVRERIATLIRANDHVRKKEISREELHTLQAATGRLDQLLSQAAEAEKENLRTAATRLDQILKDLARGKDVAKSLKRRDGREEEVT
jgi:hypothetical protein